MDPLLHLSGVFLMVRRYYEILEGGLLRLRKYFHYVTTYGLEVKMDSFLWTLTSIPHGSRAYPARFLHCMAALISYFPHVFPCLTNKLLCTVYIRGEEVWLSPGSKASSDTLWNSLHTTRILPETFVIFCSIFYSASLFHTLPIGSWMIISNTIL